MNKIAIGIGVGITTLTAVILIIVFMGISASGSKSEDAKTLQLPITVGGKPIKDGTVVTGRDMNNDEKPIQLITICEGEETKFVSCTWIPLDEAKRTPEEQALAERAESN